MKNKIIIALKIPVFGILFLFFLIFLLSDEPVKTVYFYFTGPFMNIFTFGNMFNAAIPLILGALGIITAMKAGNLNLGGEGQVYLGAFVTVISAMALSHFNAIGSVIAVIFGCLCTGLVSGFSGFCKAKWNTNELITTFLLSCAVIPIINYFVTGPFQDPQSSLITTKKIAENMRLPLILKPSSLSIGLIIAVIFAVLIHYFFKKTKMGYEFKMTGYNELFARYGGINTKLNIVLAMFISGFLYGLAGSLLVLGTHYAVLKEFSAGMGWAGLTTALIAGFSPIAVIPSALFLAWINTGARIAMQNTGLTLEVAYIVQAVIFLLSTSITVKKLLFIRKG